MDVFLLPMECVNADFGRQLERELTASRAHAAELAAKLAQAETERDENHKMWEHWQTEAVRAQGSREGARA